MCMPLLPLSKPRPLGLTRRRGGAAAGRALLVLLSGFILLCTSLPTFAQEGDRRRVDRRLGFEEPQLALTPGGAVVMLWARPSSIGHDLFVSVRDQGGHFGEAAQVNDRVGSVSVLALDEARPALATGPDETVAVGWVDDEGDVVVALGRKAGARFEPPVRVNGRGGRPERNFVNVALDERGTIHVVWLDARNAPAGQEEPAQVYYAQVIDGKEARPETAVTAEYTTSVCGCCRPFVRSDRHGTTVLYRNVDEEGYRDIHRIQSDPDGRFGEPERMGPPTWKLEGCPMMGPVGDGERVLWRDGSTGSLRIVEAFSPTARLLPVIVAEDSWVPTGSPRFVDASEGVEPAVLVPGRPHPRLLHRTGGQWRIWIDELPTWCLSAVVLNDQLLMVGDQYGELKMEALALPGASQDR